MRFMSISLIVFTICLTVLKSLTIYKAVKKDYSSIYITMFRGYAVKALLKEKDIKTDKVKKLIIINSVLDLIYLVAIIFYFQFMNNALNSGTFTDGNFGSPFSVWALIIIKFTYDSITDWQIKKAVKQSSSEKNNITVDESKKEV